MSFSIRFVKRVEKDLKRLPSTTLQRIDSVIVALGITPRPLGCTKMAGTTNTHRIRVGDYRIVYDIHDDTRIVVILIVAHRKEVYRGF